VEVAPRQKFACATNINGLPFVTNFNGLLFETNINGMPFATNINGLPFATNIYGLPFATNINGLPFATNINGLPFATAVGEGEVLRLCVRDADVIATTGLYTRAYLYNNTVTIPRRSMVTYRRQIGLRQGGVSLSSVVDILIRKI
jgi:hypothetical protein